MTVQASTTAKMAAADAIVFIPPHIRSMVAMVILSWQKSFCMEG